MIYGVEIWRYHKKCKYLVGNKKHTLKVISRYINDYDEGECAIHIYRIMFFGLLIRRVSLSKKMKFLEQARQ